MPTDALAQYLQDHLAGSVAALQLMETLADQERGTPLEPKLRALHTEVSEEQEGIRTLLARLDGEESRLKQAAAWLTEKMHVARLALAERSHPALARLQGLESLALGLQGKLALYRALEQAATREPKLGGYPFAALQARTLSQHGMIEQERMAAAREALESPTVGPDESGERAANSRAASPDRPSGPVGS
jgi:hypothetical protein